MRPRAAACCRACSSESALASMPDPHGRSAPPAARASRVMLPSSRSQSPRRAGLTGRPKLEEFCLRSAGHTPDSVCRVGEDVGLVPVTREVHVIGHGYHVVRRMLLHVPEPEVRVRDTVPASFARTFRSCALLDSLLREPAFIQIQIVEDNEAGFSRSGEPSRTSGTGPVQHGVNPPKRTHPLALFAYVGLRFAWRQPVPGAAPLAASTHRRTRSSRLARSNPSPALAV